MNAPSSKDKNIRYVTAKQMTVIEKLIEDKSLKMIAAELHITDSGVHKHIHEICLPNGWHGKQGILAFLVRGGKFKIKPQPPKEEKGRK